MIVYGSSLHMRMHVAYLQQPTYIRESQLELKNNLLIYNTITADKG